MEIVIASANVHKIREFRDMLRPYKHLDVRSLLNFPLYVPPEETGQTFQENALLKAQHAAHELDKWVIADDSGLVVPALAGQPGIFSRRFSGVNSTDAENRHKLLAELQDKSEFERLAYYQCSLVIAAPTKVVKCANGICEGFIIDKERGRNGFGYDPLFIKHEYNKTFAELDEQTKNRISHRRKAFDQIAGILENVRDERDK